MTLTLRIENFDQLPDGGPTFYSIDQAGFEIGRAQHLDWTLPDPDRLISGHHAEVRYDNGGYYLHDVSRNGTLLNGGSSRMKSPHQLMNGDRLQIGHYVIAVEITDGEGAVAAPSPAASSNDIWDMSGPTPEPMDRRAFKQDQRPASRAPDFANQHLDLPAYSPPPSEATPDGESPFQAGSQAASGSPFQPSAGPLPVESQQPARGWQPPFQGEAFVGNQLPPAASSHMPAPAPVAPQPMSAPAAPPKVSSDTGGDGAVDARLFFAAMAEAAGVPVETFTARAPIEVAQEIGAVLRCSTDELTGLLKARAAAKKLAKSADRTMITASDNNAMKFIPSTVEAMEIMFARNRPGYMGAAESFKSSFEDLKKHEYATYAAMQKALARLLEGLSPEAIEKKISGGVIGSKKAKAWDIFVERWDAQTELHENGMLDVFLTHFAEAYDEASSN